MRIGIRYRQPTRWRATSGGRPASGSTRCVRACAGRLDVTRGERHIGRACQMPCVRLQDTLLPAVWFQWKLKYGIEGLSPEEDAALYSAFLAAVVPEWPLADMGDIIVTLHKIAFHSYFTQR